MRPGLYAFALAAAFLGATIYIGLVEQPARLKLSSRAMIQEWKLSNRRGTLVLSVLAVLSATIAFIQFRMNGDVRWTIGGRGAGRDFGMIEARFVKIRRDNLDVNEMPLPCLLSRTVDVGIPVLVCSSRL